MQKIIFMILFLFIFYSVSSVAQKKVIEGQFTWEEWKKTADWQSYEAEDYTPDSMTVESLSKYIVQSLITFKIFSASWCHDSEMEMPKIIALLLKCGIPEDNIKIWGVDRNKREPDGFAELFQIEKVPTLIIERNCVEIGRIVEYPDISWEQDILNIISQN